jgi:hypothetical protein
MDRNRWETALRCLEIAVHPNTSDKEVIAAVNGFRRTADRVALRQLCGGAAAAPPEHLLDRLDQLNRENRELRRGLADSEKQRAAAARTLEQAELRAENAEQRLAEFRGAYGRISGGLQHENTDLRRALDDARRDLAQPIYEPVKPFQAALKAALHRPAPAAPMSAPMTGRLGSA